MTRKKVLVLSEHSIIRRNIAKILEEKEAIDVVVFDHNESFLSELNWSPSCRIVVIDCKAENFDPYRLIFLVNNTYPSIQVMTISADNSINNHNVVKNFSERDPAIISDYIIYTLSNDFQEIVVTELKSLGLELKRLQNNLNRLDSFSWTIISEALINASELNLNVIRKIQQLNRFLEDFIVKESHKFLSPEENVTTDSTSFNNNSNNSTSLFKK